MIGFWVFMLMMDILSPAVMIGVGIHFAKKAPEKINYLFGYRTERSMKNTDTWNFAHRHIGKLWKNIGWIMLPLSVIPMVFVFGSDAKTVGIVGGAILFAQIVPVFLSIVSTERALKKNFNNYGIKR